MKVLLFPSKLRKILTFMILVLLLLNISYVLVKYVLIIEPASRYMRFFYFDNERSIPTVFSGMQLFIASLLLYMISMKRELTKILRFQWIGLSLIFLFLAIDESISIHEALVRRTRSVIPITSEFLTFAWVIPYSIGCILFVLLGLGFLKKLPNKTRWFFITSGFIYCAGAIGMELIGGKIDSQIGKENLIFALSVTLEETLEMFGICLFIYALANYISEDMGALKVVIEKKQKA